MPGALLRLSCDKRMSRRFALGALRRIVVRGLTGANA